MIACIVCRFRSEIPHSAPTRSAGSASASAGWAMPLRQPGLRKPGSAHRPAFKRALSSATRLNYGQAEAQVVAPVRRLEPAAARRPADAGEADPAPAADHPGRGPRRPPRVVHNRLLVIGITVPIPAPLPNIAVHVIQPEGITSLLADRMGRTARVPRVPSRITQLGGIVSEGVLRRRTRPARIFPLWPLSTLPWDQIPFASCRAVRRAAVP